MFFVSLYLILSPWTFGVLIGNQELCHLLIRQGVRLVPCLTKHVPCQVICLNESHWWRLLCKEAAVDLEELVAIFASHGYLLSLGQDPAKILQTTEHLIQDQA